MRQLKYIGLLIVLLAGIQCEVKVPNPNIPFLIETGLPKGTNEIEQVFALPDQSFIILTQDRANNISKFYKYDRKLILVDSATLSGIYYSKPVIEDNGFITMVAEGLENVYGLTYIVRLDFNLKLVEKRNIQSFYTGRSGHIKYYNKLMKLANGNYVMATTYERFPDLADKIVMFCMKDPFNDNQVVWRVNPSGYNGEWLEETAIDKDGNFYFAATDHLGATANYLIKYDSDGKLIFKNQLPQTHSNFHLFVDDSRVIYHDFMEFSSFGHDGSLLSKTPINGNWGISSNLIGYGSHFFYAIDLNNSDGKFLQLRKTAENFTVIKSAYFGNRGTNISDQPQRFFVRLSSGEFIGVAQVENPDLSGNHWLIQKVDENLEMK